MVRFVRESGQELPRDQGEAAFALRLVRTQVLQNIAICFSGVFHHNLAILANQQHPLWKEGERFGAKCVTSIADCLAERTGDAEHVAHVGHLAVFQLPIVLSNALATRNM